MTHPTDAEITAAAARIAAMEAHLPYAQRMGWEQLKERARVALVDFRACVAVERETGE